MFPNTPSIFGAGASGGGGGGGNSYVANSGRVLAVSFAGTPKKYVVVFATPYADALYSISLSGADSRLYTFESKTANGFTINTNADAAVAGEVLWFTTPLGETP